MIRLVPRLALMAFVFAFAACSKPEPPETERPPEPQAASTVASQPSALREYMQTPIDKAKTAETAVLDAAEEQRNAIDAQTAGDVPAADAPPGNTVPTY